MKLTPTRLLVIAGAVALLGLALPWRPVTTSSFTSEYQVGMCHWENPWGDPVYVCEGDSIVFYNTFGSIEKSGFDSSVRIYAAVAILLAVMALRSRSSKLAGVSLAVGAVGMLIGGRLPSQAGAYTFIAALALAALAFHQAGLLNMRRRLPQPRQAM